jgi:hypothetical protein
MTTGGRRLRKENELEAQLLAALARPSSPREVFAVVGATVAIMRTFNRLMIDGKVIRHGARRTFDHGHEVLYVAARVG